MDKEVDPALMLGHYDEESFLLKEFLFSVTGQQEWSILFSKLCICSLGLSNIGYSLPRADQPLPAVPTSPRQQFPWFT